MSTAQGEVGAYEGIRFYSYPDARHAIRVCVDRALTIWRRDTNWGGIRTVNLSNGESWIPFPAEYRLAHYIWTGRLP